MSHGTDKYGRKITGMNADTGEWYVEEEKKVYDDKLPPDMYGHRANRVNTDDRNMSDDQYDQMRNSYLLANNLKIKKVQINRGDVRQSVEIGRAKDTIRKEKMVVRAKERIAAKDAEQARISRPKVENPTATASVATKKQVPLLNEEKSSLYNNLNKMSQEQLRKYVSTFNKEARIVGGHAMTKVQIINAIIDKAKTIDSLLKKLRVEKIDTGAKSVAGYTLSGVAIDKTGTKTRETEPKTIGVNEKVTDYQQYKGEGTGYYLPGYATKGPVAGNRFSSYSGARNACDRNGNCGGITKEIIKGETFYSTRSSRVVKQKAGSNEVSWVKKTVTPIKLKAKK